MVAPPGYVLGDGTTAGHVASERWRRWRWAGIVVIIVFGSVVAMTLLAPSGSSEPLAIDNSGPEGAMALAEVLTSHGVDVRAVDTLQDAHEQLDDAGTLVIATYAFLTWEQVDSIAAYPGPVVWLEPDSYTLEEIDPALSATWDYDVPEDQRLNVSAGCILPTPARAKSVNASPSRIVVVTGTPGFVVCFGTEGVNSGVYTHQERPEKEPAVLIADSGIFTNEHVAKGGNAALAMGTLGSRERLVWYTGAAWDDTTLTSEQGASDYYEPTAPAWLAPAMLAAVLTALLAAVWQGRRFGSLVTEPLPLVVRASEATQGRARLYRRSGARAHALAALRAGAATRLASRLALPRTASQEEVIVAVASASGRSTAEVRALLFDAIAPDDAAMVDLVRRIDALESEVDPT
jgi:hypothetical protein